GRHLADGSCAHFFAAADDDVVRRMRDEPRRLVKRIEKWTNRAMTAHCSKRRGRARRALGVGDPPQVACGAQRGERSARLCGSRAIDRDAVAGQPEAGKRGLAVHAAYCAPRLPLWIPRMVGSQKAWKLLVR